MQSQSFERHAQLAQWLHSLVEILRTTGGATWEALVETVDGKTAIIDLDGVVLRVGASGGEQLQVESAYPVAQTSVNFRSNSATLRDAIAGKLTVDAAVVSDKIYLRGNLQDLLGIHQIASGILADSAINPQLRRLWAEFDQSWFHPPSLPPCLALEQQRPNSGDLIRQVPEDVLAIQVDLPAD
ncbi:SCP2 sterol-binding domain-containing protein [Microseira wollei]|uniref:SCP2 domain-containing protein n=1 Tax=Microseira wollei NIES-4236 TaxID=2530354 RepID=A0AAV3XEZ1_9CYAN|nr:hypothetical protein [Microseira wollei]GET41138.1 hypothetical protein MiSe_59500 [Microseira wollei NIES-4236]